MLVAPGSVDPPGSPTPADAASVQPAKPPKAKKPKKKKTPKEGEPAPDEPTPEAEPIEKAGGFRSTWKQHPSLRFGDAVRVDFEAKFQEDGHSSYGPVEGLATWELHRNRIGIKGNIYKRIEYEVEYELTEKELTERDITLGYTPNSQWKDVNVNLTYIRNAQIQFGKFKIPFG